MRVNVHATPAARRNHVGGQHAGALRVSVTVPPDKGRANEAIAKELARALNVKPSQVELVSGQTNRRKVFEIGPGTNGIEDRLRALMNER